MAASKRKTGPRGAVVVLTTVATRAQALALAKALLAERRCACVSILPEVRSLYRWKERVEDARELLLLIKTTRSGLGSLERRLIELHPYEVPEFLALEPSRVGTKYARWLAANVTENSTALRLRARRDPGAGH
jgi:periplasmic divalent cation tolerance protein